ncbi:MAG TPA: hypothetical protein VM364_19575 [Vicinamibacterales bacterium]|nr:hypothetical protein [Vicinamibacterales bacterium]
MRGMQMKSLWGGVAASALLFTYGCGGAQNTTGVRAQELTGAQSGAPVVVSCEPHQRTVVRPAVVNGAAVSQVECVAANTQQAAAYAPVAQPAATGYYAPATQAQRVVYEDLAPARIVHTPVQRTAAPVRTRQVVYDEPVRVKKGRSVKKSAIIIGSSAGVGAGVGAAVGGKKGALIGAAIGGGSAAIWDQVTRRDR